MNEAMSPPRHSTTFSSTWGGNPRRRRRGGGGGRRNRSAQDDEELDGGRDYGRDDRVAPRIVHGHSPLRGTLEGIDVASFNLGRLSLEEGSSPSASSSTSSSLGVTAIEVRARSISDLGGAYASSPSCRGVASSPASAGTTPSPELSPSPSLYSSSPSPGASSSTSSKLYLRSIQYRLERKNSRSGSGNDGGNDLRSIGHTEPSSLTLPPSVPPLTSPSTQDLISSKVGTWEGRVLPPASFYSDDWTALRSERRMLEQSYPLHRENAAEQRKKKIKRSKTERKFLRLSRKAEAVTQSRNTAASNALQVVEPDAMLISRTSGSELAMRNAITPASSSESRTAGALIKAKENYAPPPSLRAKHSENPAVEGMQPPPPPSQPSSATAAMALPPRPLGPFGSRRAPRQTSSAAVHPPSYSLHRSRSASPRRHDDPSRWTVPEIEPSPSKSSSRRGSERSRSPLVFRSRSESPSASTRVPPPSTSCREVTTDTPPVAPRSHHQSICGAPPSPAPRNKLSPLPGSPSPSSGLRPPRSPAATEAPSFRYRDEHLCPSGEANRVERGDGVRLPRTRSVGPGLPSPSSVATNAFNLGAGAITKCIAPSLMDVDHRVFLMEGKSYETRPIAAAPAPFFLPGAPGSTRSRQHASGQSGLPEGPKRENPTSGHSPSTLALQRASNTREELVKLKNELQSKRKEKQMWADSRNPREPFPPPTAAYEYDTYQARKRQELRVLHGRRACEKRVRFSRPLVTAIRHRPYTKAEDIDKLYFGEDELEELELDRANVEGDQIELALVGGSSAGSALDAGPAKGDRRSSTGSGGDRGPSNNILRGEERDAATVAVTYTNKRVHHRLEEGGDEVHFSPSDDTSFTYYE